MLAQIEESEVVLRLAKDPGATWTTAGMEALVRDLFQRDACYWSLGNPPMVLNVTELRGGWVEYGNLLLAAADESPAHPKNPYRLAVPTDADCLSWLREHHLREVIMFDDGPKLERQGQT
jgi:hypothetical protein